MKRLTSIEFTKDNILINKIALGMNDDIIKWIEKNCECEYTIENYIEQSPNRKEIKFQGIDGFAIYTKGESIDRISVYPYLPNDSRNKFEGEVVVFGEVLPKPFLSDDIEDYFPDIRIEKPPRGYWERFKAWESVNFPINEFSEIEISMNRVPKYVGALNLRRKYIITQHKLA